MEMTIEDDDGLYRYLLSRGGAAARVHGRCALWSSLAILSRSIPTLLQHRELLVRARLIRQVWSREAETLPVESCMSLYGHRDPPKNRYRE